MSRFITIFVLLAFSMITEGYEFDQGYAVKALLNRKMQNGINISELNPMRPLSLPSFYDEAIALMEDDLIVGGIPGQPRDISFKQYSGHVTVDESHGRSLFYYFVEATTNNPSSEPLILWLNGGPGCSSVGIGAMVENGPFGVNRDGKTLYRRYYSWNRVANMLYLESPAGVGFSYSNTSSDYGRIGDLTTCQDSYTFLISWFKKFPRFMNSDFYIAGESYAGFYIPELVDLILQRNPVDPSLAIHVGNGLIDPIAHYKGYFEYLWSHAMISDETREGLLLNCLGPTTPLCMQFESIESYELGGIDISSLCSEPCTLGTNFTATCSGAYDPCEKNYIRDFLNNPQVQEAMHANKTRLMYPWSLCSLSVNVHWSDSASTMLPIYRRLLSTGLRILLYSGDMDGIIPWTSMKNSINELNLTVSLPWKAWIDDTGEIAGYKVDYIGGLTFATVRGAGHEVPKYQSRRAFSLMKKFLKGLL